MIKFRNRIYYVSFLGIMLSLACGLYYLEALFLNPLSSLPGAKLGIANIITLMGVYWWGLKEGLIICIFRVLIVNILLGGLFGLSFFLSLTGGIISALIMGFLANKKSFSTTFVSILGALSHNISQLIVVSFFISHRSIFFYIPFLLIFAIITGTFNGVLGNWIIKRLSFLLGGKV
ncbi:MAG: Gx transporter family protein [Dictyoglomaceae bacterium]|nr:Gx transporter family protein [Dictyoglomaceae bacterium]